MLLLLLVGMHRLHSEKWNYVLVQRPSHWVYQIKCFWLQVTEDWIKTHKQGGIYWLTGSPEVQWMSLIATMTWGLSFFFPSLSFTPTVGCLLGLTPWWLQEAWLQASSRGCCHGSRPIRAICWSWRKAWSHTYHVADTDGAYFHKGTDLDCPDIEKEVTWLWCSLKQN